MFNRSRTGASCHNPQTLVLPLSPHLWKGHLQLPATPLVRATNPGVLRSRTCGPTAGPQLPPPTSPGPPSRSGTQTWSPCLLVCCPFSSEQPEGLYKIVPHFCFSISPPHLKPSCAFTLGPGRNPHVSPRPADLCGLGPPASLISPLALSHSASPPGLADPTHKASARCPCCVGALPADSI